MAAAWPMTPVAAELRIIALNECRVCGGWRVGLAGVCPVILAVCCVLSEWVGCCCGQLVNKHMERLGAVHGITAVHVV